MPAVGGTQAPGTVGPLPVKLTSRGSALMDRRLVLAMARK